MRLEPLISHTGILMILSITRFAEFLPLIYPPEQVKETTDTASAWTYTSNLTTVY